MKLSRSNVFLVKLALSLLGYGLLAFAASRTLEFVQNTVPADKQWMGYLYLLATGVGALIWLYVYLHDAKGAKQRGIAFGMAVIDLVLEFLLVYADTYYQSSQQGLVEMSAQELETFILVSVIAVGLNAFAWFFYKLFDPDKEQERKAADFADDIEDEAMKMLSTPEARKRMIEEHAPTIKAAVMARVTDNVAARFTGDLIPADPRMPIIPDPRYHEQAVPAPSLSYEPSTQEISVRIADLKASGVPRIHDWMCFRCGARNSSESHLTHCRHCQTYRWFDQRPLVDQWPDNYTPPASTRPSPIQDEADQPRAPFQAE